MPTSKLAPALPGWLMERPLLAIQLSKHPTSGPALALREYRERRYYYCQRIASSGILTHFLRQISTKAYALEERWFAVACRMVFVVVVDLVGLVAPTVDVIERAFGFDRDFGKFLGPNPKQVATGGLDEHIRPNILLAAPRTAIGISDDPDAPLLLKLAAAQLFVEVLCDYSLLGTQRCSLASIAATFIKILLKGERTEDQQRLG